MSDPKGSYSEKTGERVPDRAVYRGGVEGPAGTAKAVPLFTVVRIAVPLFKAGRTSAANVPPRMRDCSARAYSTYAWASTVKLILTKAIV